MHGPLIATLLVAASIGLAPPSDPLVEAKGRLDANDGIAAVSILEDALAAPGVSRDAVLGLLQSAYEAAARQADRLGKPRDAETYRENLRILARKPRPAPQRVVEPPSSPSALAEPPTAIVAEPPIAPPVLSPDPVVAAPEPLVSPAVPSDAPAPDLKAADASFVAKDYPQAGRIYGALAAEGRLPKDHRPHWGYCRAFEVVRRINARPTDAAEWASINAEIAQVQVLLPDNWFKAYLKNATADRQATRKRSDPGKLVVRANSPEDPTAERPVRTASNISTTEASRPAMPEGASRIGTEAGRWRLKETTNFKIYHADPVLAEKVAIAAEAVRRDQTQRWTGAPPRSSWTPLCEIYLYPSARQFAQMTGQPEESPGFSTMGMNEGRIISRRVNLRADHATLLTAVLPHEVTHVILADSFPLQQIPRWADEGMAVLSEPIDEQRRRAVDLAEPLGKNMLFPIDTLMNMDYPDNQYWGLYYAQSVSLTRFLVEQGTPNQLLQFLQGAQTRGPEAELKRIYQIDGFGDLQARWVAYARRMAAPAQAAKAPATVDGPDLRVR